MTSILNTKPGEANFSPVGRQFSFACHPKSPCFNACCRGLNMVLTPYDVLRLSKRLNLTSSEFLDKHTLPAKNENSRWPLIRLKMNDDEEQTCSFLTDSGCGVYEDRSSACRTYPLARAISQGYSEDEVVEQFFKIEEAHCRGFEEDRVWTVEEWVSDQGLLRYHRYNDKWMMIVTNPKGPGEGAQAEKNRQMFYLASYNLDQFRKFVTTTKFLNLFEIEDRIISNLDDGEILLGLALDFLSFSLLGRKTLKLK